MDAESELREATKQGTEMLSAKLDYRCAEKASSCGEALVFLQSGHEWFGRNDCAWEDLWRIPSSVEE